MTEEATNTDRELWRERDGDYYAASVFVTEGGGIGLNVGGHCIVKPIRDWHALAVSQSRPTKEADGDEHLAKLASLQNQVGKLYRVCNERDVFKNALQRIENHELRDHEDYTAIQEIASFALRSVTNISPTKGADITRAREQIVECARVAEQYNDGTGFATARGIAAAIRALSPAPAQTEEWRPGNPRCDECDNGLERSWVYCPFCGEPALPAPVAPRHTPEKG